ncbi:hypothetical protein KK062_17415 [Fulvivirgaceae bacterium PWU5]|uniref:Uncharacterized protein n=1 Tax=Dawidia cretensis TaxID=2782350 RepID=A0AAP2E1Y4_9BACT|nr:hypothetical protein [Dawidia cretensis]MBT1710029.1 hypothetical protein [Dawidia cretensis]
MLFPKAKKIARTLGWHKTENSVFGFYKGYSFTIGDGPLLGNPQYKYVEADMGTLTGEQRQQLWETLTKNKKILRFTKFEISQRTVYIQFIEVWRFTKSKTVYALLDFLAAQFATIGAMAGDTCSTCNSRDGVVAYNQSETGVMLCQQCFSIKEKELGQQERQNLLEEKNYIAGFVGSILFSAPGIVAWVLLAVYLERMAAVMALLIAFLGVKGYVFFKGKQGPAMKYVIVLSNIVCILLANYITIGTLLYREGLEIPDILDLFLHGDEVKDVLFRSIGMSATLAVIVWISLLSSLKAVKLQIRLAEKVV